jgi:hypothetical protein
LSETDAIDDDVGAAPRARRRSTDNRHRWPGSEGRGQPRLIFTVDVNQRA